MALLVTVVLRTAGVPPFKARRRLLPLALCIRPWGLGLALGLGALLGVLASLPPAWAEEELFVANVSNNSVTVYARTASGDTAPLRTLAGPATGLSGPVGLVVDLANHELVVTNSSNDSVTVYARTASGDTAPLRTLAGPATKLCLPTGLAVDPVNDELVVANYCGGITVYARTASGNTAPLRTLSGPATGIIGPTDLAVDALNNELVVTDIGGSFIYDHSIRVYARTATGNASPLRTLSGRATGLNKPWGVAVDPLSNELVVANYGDNSIRVYPRTASGDTAPLRTLEGRTTGLSIPQGVAVDALNNELVVTNLYPTYDQNSRSYGYVPVTVYARTASGNTAPLRTLTGPATGLGGPHGVAVDLVNNELVVTNVGSNSVTVYARTASGNTAPLRTLQGPPTVLTPQFLAITTSPTAGVALNGSVFYEGRTITYQATLTPASTPTRVDIYLGALLPDGVTFLSLVQVAPGVISATSGSSPTPFLANVPLTQSVVPFSYTFTGYEPDGTYSTYARLTNPGSNPLLPENQLGVAVESFQFSSDVCLSVSVSGRGSVTSSPRGNGRPGCFATFPSGTTVTLTAQTAQGGTFDGWTGDCASAGTHATCTLVMTTNEHVGASFSTAGSGGSGCFWICPFCWNCLH
jgi:DNA-binding beta-propeller fold protein YncE